MPDSHAYTDSNGHSYCYTYGHSHSLGDGNAYTHTELYSKTFTDAEIGVNTEAPSHAATATITCFMKKKPNAQSGLFSLRTLASMLVCAAAMCSMIVTGTLLAFWRSDASVKVSHPAGAGLTFAARVSYQRAIEEVYWRHRIWPKENSKPKPSLDEVMSAQQIERKVEDYLRDAQALEDYWQRPITPDELQAEMQRIASYTKQPAMLRELFEALGNDPFLIAECLARPVLAERLLTNLNAHYRSILGELKVQPEYRRASADNRAPYSMTAAGASYRLPTVSDRPNGCSDETWTTISNTNAPAARASHTAVWTGSEMIVWGGYGGTYLNTGGRYDPSTDSWTAISTINAPAPRGGNTAVWTGSEMIVWGGDDGFSVNTGGKYNPATDTWTATNTATAPLGRIFHTAVWDGSEMIVWGGWNEIELRTGGRYNPGTDSWAATSITSAPSARYDHTAVWTGSEMIVWGGWNGSNSFNTGGRYNPGTDGWTAISTTNAPDCSLRSHGSLDRQRDDRLGRKECRQLFQYRRQIQSKHRQLGNHQHDQCALGPV